jgi:hypothetical protein
MHLAQVNEGKIIQLLEGPESYRYIPGTVF